MRRPAAFLDRDGTLIEDTSFVRDPAAIRVLPGAAQAVRLLNEHGVLSIVITNQSGVARNLMGERDVEAVNAELRARIAADGATIDAFYYCPHLDDGCDCRKPLPGMIRRAVADHPIDLARSVVIGDRATDIGVAEAAGIPGILVASDRYRYAGPEPAFRAASVLDAVRWMVERVGV